MTAGSGGPDLPGGYTERTGRVAVARKLTRRHGREAERLFLAEGPQAVREALWLAGTGRSGTVRELFGTGAALGRHPELAAAAARQRIRVSTVTERAVAGLSETSTPQGLVAVCEFLDVSLAEVFALVPRPATGPAGPAGPPGLVAVLADIRDPGNAGTVLRSADAAGAAAVVFAGESVDPYNGKAVRASAGSLFHLPVVRGASVPDAVAAARSAGLAVLVADGAGEVDLDVLQDGTGLARPTAWIFGNEAAGLSSRDAVLADARIRIPLHGRAESLNLAVAAALCLYASARAQRR